MVMGERGKVEYKDIAMDLAMEEYKLNDVLKENRDSLTWMTKGELREEEEFDYVGAETEDFYKEYYKHVEDRSPLRFLSKEIRDEVKKKKKEVGILYTAFYGVGATVAGDLPGFFQRVGYSIVNKINLVQKQTEVMDGTFPGHGMPDPGVVEGWVVNFVDYLVQIGGKDLSGIEEAIEELNKKDAGVGTDPDIDRAGMAIPLPKGVEGNIKGELLKAVMEYIEKTEEIKDKKKVKGEVRKAFKKLNDYHLLTANDAWTFMAYHILKLREENGALDKDKLYVILKSHVTTSALERVAEVYQEKGYKVYVVDTYVGFTELAKKSRDLIEVARNIYKAKGEIEDGKVLEDILKVLKEANEELKRNVPYETAGLEIFDEAIRNIERIARGEEADREKIIKDLDLIGNIEIVMGVEESNGYGEFGYYDPEAGEVKDAHICEKDGSLAAYEFLDLVSYGRYKGQSLYDMYQELMRETGLVGTDNRFLLHPGLKGVDEKVNEVEFTEKVFAVLLQKELDKGEEVKLFDGKYRLKEVIVYRDGKYDNNYKGFPEEGIQLILETEQGSDAIVTIRPSGTGDSIRVYSWIMGQVPEKGADIEVYRRQIGGELKQLGDDFFIGYLSKLRDVGVTRYKEVMDEMLGKELRLSEREEEVRAEAYKYVQAVRDREASKEVEEEIRKAEERNESVWDKYLSSEESEKYPEKIDFYLDGEVIANIPKALVFGWQTAVVGYISSKIAKGKEKEIRISCENTEVAEQVKERLEQDKDFADRKIIITAVEQDIQELIEELEKAKDLGQENLENKIREKIDEVLLRKAESTRLVYDQMVDKYEQIRGQVPEGKDEEMLNNFLKLVREIKSIDLKQEKIKILDVGTGLRDLKWFLKHKDIFVIGIDFSERVVKFIRESIGREKLDVLQMDMNHLEFSDNMFEGVRSQMSLHHLPVIDSQQGADVAIRETYRVLKPGGIFKVSVKAETEDRRGFKGLDTKEGLGKRYYQFYSPELLKSVLERQGFTLLGLGEIEEWTDSRGEKNLVAFAIKAEEIKIIPEESIKDLSELEPIIELLTDKEKKADKSDVLILCGNDNIDTFKEALRLYKEGIVKKILITGGKGRLTLPLMQAAVRNHYSIEVAEGKYVRTEKDINDLLDEDGELIKDTFTKSEAEIIEQIMKEMAVKEGIEIKKEDIFLEKKSRITRENFIYSKPILKEIRKELKMGPKDTMKIIMYMQTPIQQLRTKGVFNKIFEEEIKQGTIFGVSWTIDYVPEKMDEAESSELIEKLLKEMWQLIVFSAIGDISLEYEGKKGLESIPVGSWEKATRLIDFHIDPVSLAKNLIEREKDNIANMDELKRKLDTSMTPEMEGFINRIYSDAGEFSVEDLKEIIPVKEENGRIWINCKFLDQAVKDAAMKASEKFSEEGIILRSTIIGSARYLAGEEGWVPLDLLGDIDLAIQIKGTNKIRTEIEKLFWINLKEELSSLSMQTLSLDLPQDLPNHLILDFDGKITKRRIDCRRIQDQWRKRDLEWRGILDDNLWRLVSRSKKESITLRDVRNMDEKIKQGFLDDFSLLIREYLQAEYYVGNDRIYRKVRSSLAALEKDLKNLDEFIILWDNIVSSGRIQKLNKFLEENEQKTEELVRNRLFQLAGEAKSDQTEDIKGITPTESMKNMKFLMDLLELKEYGRQLGIMMNALDVHEFVKNLMRASGKSVKEVMDILVDIPAFREKALKCRFLTAKYDKNLSVEESTNNYLEIEVTKKGSIISSDYQSLEEGEGVHLSNFMAEKFKKAVNTIFPYRDDMEQYVGRFLGLEGFGEDKPEVYSREEDKINKQELSDLRESIDKVKEYLLKGENVNIEEIINLINNGIGANEMYLHQDAQMVNELAEDLGIDFHWEVVDNPADYPRVEKNCKEITERNTIAIDMSRSGGTEEPQSFMEMTKDEIVKRIVWANKGRFYEIGEEIRKSHPKLAAILHINNTPGTIGGRHMNLKTDMVFTPLFTAFLIMGCKKYKDKGEAVEWAEEQLRVYVENLYKGNEQLSPKQEDFGKAANNAASQIAIEDIRKRDVEGRVKLGMIFDPGLKHFATEFFQNANEGIAKPAPGKERNNNMHSFWDAREDYMTTFEGKPELYQLKFIVNMSSEYAEDMLSKAKELSDKGIPVKVVKMDLRKKKGGMSKKQIEELFRHNLAVQAQATALLQTVVTTFTHLTDQDANSNPAVKTTREVTEVIKDIFVALKKKLGMGEEVKVTLEQIKEKMEEAREDALKDARKEIEGKVALAEKKRGEELPEEFKEFIDKGLNQITDGLEMGDNKEEIVRLFTGTISRGIFSADMAESGGLKSALMEAALEKDEFLNERLGKYTKDFHMPELSKQVDVYEKEGISISIACPESVTKAEEKSYRGKNKEEAEEGIANYLYDLYSSENRHQTMNTIGVGYVDADTGNEEIALIMEEVNKQLAKFGINSLPMNFPRIAHTGIEAAQALVEIMAIIALLPRETFEEGEGKFGSKEIRDGLTVNDVNYIYILANVMRMAIGGSPTVMVDYKNKEQLPEIREIMVKALGVFAEKVNAKYSDEIKTTEEIIEEKVFKFATELKGDYGDVIDKVIFVDDVKDAHWFVKVDIYRKEITINRTSTQMEFSKILKSLNTIIFHGLANILTLGTKGYKISAGTSLKIEQIQKPLDN
ncbi:methyltransferase domain-containing protein, partial [bacterium]|nr:methyltransferase domain-containing protein [bacterium]